MTQSPHMLIDWAFHCVQAVFATGSSIWFRPMGHPDRCPREELEVQGGVDAECC